MATNRSLAQQLYEQQKTLATQQHASDTASLQEQLRLQRQNMMLGRQQLGEQGWQTNRAIDQQARARGLGSSGLRNLSLIQSQLAQGQAANTMENSNAEVQKQAMLTRGTLGQTLQNNLRAADMDYAQQVQGAEDAKRQSLIQLYQMAMGGATTQTIAEAAAMAGIDMASLTQEEKSALRGIDPMGGMSFTDKWDWGNIGLAAGAGAAGGAIGGSVAPVIGTGIGAAIGGVGGALVGMGTEMSGGSLRGGQPIVLTDNSGIKHNYTSWDDAVAKIQQSYAGQRGSEAIKAVKKGNAVKFQINGAGEYYSTWNEALSAYNASKSS